MTQIQNIRGTVDILPSQSFVWEWIENKARNLFQRFHCAEIRTPIFEVTELFQRSIGEGSDIVNKEMYTFADKKGRSITLRPEGTASVVRSCLQNKLNSPNTVQKFFYIGPMFRYERPQMGRQRQFHQIGVEMIGSDKSVLDLEAILLLQSFFKEVGIDSLRFRINSTGSRANRPHLYQEMRKIVEPQLAKFCPNCHARFETNILRIYDCKVKECQEIIATFPGTSHFLTEEDKNYFQQVLKGLDICGVSYTLDDHLVRGLDYYTHTVFEAYSNDLEIGACDALAGGGRYDGLFEELGSELSVPTVGFAIGVERIFNVLQTLNRLPSVPQLDIFVVAPDEAQTLQNLNMVHQLRAAGFSVDYDLLGRKMKHQFRLAAQSNAQLALIRGEEEALRGVVKIKVLASHEESEILETELINKIKTLLPKEIS
jgi:histidyl-tRNA synthetase